MCNLLLCGDKKWQEENPSAVMTGTRTETRTYASDKDVVITVEVQYNESQR